MSKFWGYTFNENGEYYFPIELDSNNIDQISHFKSLQKAVIDLQEKCKFEDEIHMEL